MSPAVNLDLQQVPFAILEVVKARILANRRRLGVGQDQQKPPPSLKPRPQLRKFGASSKNYRRPQPAAVAVEKPTLGNLVQEKIQYSQRITFRLYSGDGRTTIAGPTFETKEFYNFKLTMTSPVVVVFTDDGLEVLYRYVDYQVTSDNRSRSEYTEEQIYCLPVGGDVFIFSQKVRLVTNNFRNNTRHGSVPLGSKAWPGSPYMEIVGSRILVTGALNTGQKFTDEMPAYPVDFFGPWALNSFPIFSYDGYIMRNPLNYDFYWDNINTSRNAEILSFSDVTTYGKFTTQCFICSNNTIRPITAKGVFADILKDDELFDTSTIVDQPEFVTDEYQFTPTVFQRLNEQKSFVSSDQIKTFPANERPVIGDARIGFFSDQSWDTWQERLPRPTNFAKWNGTVLDVPEVDHDTSALYNRYTPIPEAVPPFTGTLEVTPDNDENADDDIRRFFVWDWDDPDYCRRMCLALGFTEADLTP